jgi:hypothetical protein
MRRVYHGTVKRADKFLKIRILPNANLLILGNLASNDGDFNGIDTNSLSCQRILVAELDTAGNFIKTKVYAYCGQTIPTDIVLDSHANIYISGHTISQQFDFSANPEGGLETNAFLIRLDTAFNTKWLNIFDAPGSQDIEPHICINSTNEILYTTSSIEKGGYFNSMSPTPTGLLYIFCIDSTQSLKWQKCYGNVTNGIGTSYVEAPLCIVWDSVKKNIYVIGVSTSKDGDMFESLDQNPFIYSESSFVIKLDSIGNKLWSHRYGAFSANNPVGITNPSSAGFDAFFHEGYLYVLSEVMYSDSNFTGVAVNNDQQTDQWLISIDSMGVLKNKARIGGASYERWGWLNVNKSNKNIIVAMRSESTNCYTDTFGSYIIYECGVWPTSVTESEFQQNNISLAPNPANTICNILFSEATTEEYSLSIHDESGRKIRTEKIDRNTNVYKINIQTLNKGNYLLELKSKKRKLILKLSKV